MRIPLWLPDPHAETFDHVLLGGVIDDSFLVCELGESVSPVLHFGRQTSQHRQCGDHECTGLFVEINDAPWWGLVGKGMG